MPKRDAPENCYWRGEVLWGRLKVAGQEYRWSLRTGHGPTALRRVEAKRKELQAAAFFGESRKTYDDTFAAWSEHILHHVGSATSKRYSVSLGQLAGFLRPLYIDEIDRAVINDIVKARRAAGVSTATIKRDLTALSSVLAYAEDEEWRTGNPALERARRLKERRDPIILPDPADVERVVARAPGCLAWLFRAARATGCRENELATIERRRMDLRGKRLTIVGKRNKLRVVELSDAAVATLRAVPVKLGCQWLFWHGEGEPYANVSSRAAAIITGAQEAAQREGVEFRRFRFHDLRHLYAVEYLRNRVGSLYDLQQQMGHSSIKTTELYLAYLTPEEARDAKQGASQKAAHEQRFDEAESA